MKRVFAVLLVFLLLGCSGNALQSTIKIPVRVENNSWSDVTVYVYQEYQGISRLGRVTAQDVEDFYLVGGGRATFKVVQFVSHDEVILPDVFPHESSYIRIQIMNYLPMSNVAVFPR